MSEYSFTIDFIDKNQLLTRIDNMNAKDLLSFIPIFVFKNAGWSVKTEEEIMTQIDVIEVNKPYIIAENTLSLCSVVVTKNQNENCIIHVQEQQKQYNPLKILCVNTIIETITGVMTFLKRFFF
jgi:fucose permease